MTEEKKETLPKKNKGGAPFGNKNGQKGREVTKALNQALAIASGDRDCVTLSRYAALVNIWLVQIKKALGGDNDSARIIFERLEGKPRIQAEISVNDSVPRVIEIPVYDEGSDSANWERKAEQLQRTLLEHAANKH